MLHSIVGLVGCPDQGCFQEVPVAAGTRDRMVRSASVLLRENGVRGTSFARVLEHSGAPRGSVAHHFPGGKEELILSAVTSTAADITARLQALADSGAGARGVVAAMCGYFAEGLKRTGFRAGCPVAAVAYESYDDPVLRAAAQDAFTAWAGILTGLLRADGHPQAAAEDLAGVCIAAIEGALVMSRVGRDLAPLDATGRQLDRMLSAPAPRRSR